MKFNFKIQQYQTDAVESVVNVFAGQPFQQGFTYRRDLGIKEKKANQQIDLSEYDKDDTGFCNREITLTQEQMLNNIKHIQIDNNIPASTSLVKEYGKCSLDVEMETGTGKTYVYIKTMFELNKRYGWSKFIVVVPSIAIREGVYKSFEITTDHFRQHYNKKARFFIYNSKNLNDLDSFSSDSGINVMIINMQAFATSLKEGARNKESRIIYSKRDEFGSRRPIDVIKKNNPIIILDEPQKMGGDVTQKAIKNFNPLFSLNYSATHKKKHNKVYSLDALDAYNKKLVKKIEVKGFEVKNLRGTDSYLFLEGITLSSSHPPVARIELEIAQKNTVAKRKLRKFNVKDNLYFKSNNMEQYKGYIISDINPLTNTVTFSNGVILSAGEVVGDVSEKDMCRIQIRETIMSHFEKEEQLFNQGIKTLSLFFIDEVAKYRQYDEDGNELLGEYGKVFEEEYIDILNEYRTLHQSDYQKYLDNIETLNTHIGYFSIDKKTGHSIDSKINRGSEYSDDISAYDLILKNKERLLSFEEPTRFIFSHSALREGWDNPNVFQICTLKHSNSETAKRQEVGRGMRLCVNKSGNRMDSEFCGEKVHDINKLTVIASESYQTFVSELQKQISEVLAERPRKASKEFFIGKTIKNNDGQFLQITEHQANVIHNYLVRNYYIDDDDNITIKYREDNDSNTLKPLPDEFISISNGIQLLVQSVYNPEMFKDMVDDGNKSKVTENKLNNNFYKKEFQELWKKINHKYAYTVHFDSKELIKNSIQSINKNLLVTKLSYTSTTGIQDNILNEHKLERGDSFSTKNIKTKILQNYSASQIKYDIVGKISEKTVLTRKTVAQILKAIKLDKFYMYKNNPEEFITKVSKIILEEKANNIVEHISYNQIEGGYDNSIFTTEKSKESFSKAFKADKNVQDYVFTDGIADESIEKMFAKNLDSSNEVCVYAKLPKGFAIPTPVGNYSPDWAIAFKEGTVKHIFFIAETKGSLKTIQLRGIEKSKTDCAKKLFNNISTDDIKYDIVDTYEKLMDVVNC